jgi:hypothetical protein
MQNPTSVIISEKAPAEKLPLTHFEKYIQSAKKLYGTDPLKEIAAACPLIPNYSEGKLDDRPYRRVAIELIKKAFKRATSPQEQYALDHLTVDDFYKDAILASEFRSALNLLHHIHLFSKTRMVFQFAEALTAKLLYTDVHKVDSSFVVSPFPSIYLDIPHNRDLMIRNEITGMHRVVGIYVSYTEEVQHLNESYPEKEKDSDGIHPSLKWEGQPCNKAFRIFAVGEKNSQSLDDMDDATFFMTLLFGPGDVFPQLERTLEVNTPTINKGKDEGHMRKLFEFVLNALLYISSPSADFVKIPAKAEPVQKKDKKKKPAKRYSSIGVVSTGSKVYISHEYRKSYREGTLGDLPQARKNAKTPTWMVRGHYRNQAHGPNMSLRCLKWIHPHVKGKGIDDAVCAREYIVK